VSSNATSFHTNSSSIGGKTKAPSRDTA
jgi:hypothetical protein